MTTDKKTTKRQANHTKPHVTKSSKTLMRKAVKKPSPSLKRQIKSQGVVDPHRVNIVIKVAPSGISVKQRHSSAARAQRSSHISHFSRVNASTFNRPTFVNEPLKPVAQTVISRPIVISSSVAQTPSEQLDQMLSKALEAAVSHEQPAFQFSGRRPVAKRWLVRKIF